ncbi:MAG UNVERIFIED_CONTAM: thioredoxin [Rickettsiaceae bacterium]|jgi:thioredoxin 1
MASQVNDDNFEKEVLKSEVPVLVDFWAEWCGPCRMLGPVIDELSTDYKGKVHIVKMNIDENPGTPSRLGVRGIPTMIMFKNGVQIGTKVGALPKNSLAEWIDSLI